MAKIDDGELLAELQNDPNGMGYAGGQPDGFKTTKELLQLLGGRREVSNPDPAPQIRKKVDVMELISLLPEEEVASMDIGTVARVRDLVEDNDLEGIQLLIAWLEIRGKQSKQDNKLTQPSVDLLRARLLETEDDPSHSPTILDPATPRTKVLWNKNTDRQQVNLVLGRDDNDPVNREK